MAIKMSNEIITKIVKIFPLCLLILVVSSFCFYLLISILEGEYLYFLLLSSTNLIPLYCVIIYSIFAIPLQIFLNSNPKKFNLFYLFFYTICSFVALFIISIVLFTISSIDLLKMAGYYKFSFSIALIFWFWDSIFSQTKVIASNKLHSARD
ncbi:hypothetical protein JOC75_000688 [Metabacillus crassostreae]|uniref:UPF0715 family protein n=1 Tax=Metabacillus crassostreae TaxID=929098 RepID=UPI001959DC0C|nr:hypothetical protein [Metabacillus crassostreae]